MTTPQSPPDDEFEFQQDDYAPAWIAEPGDSFGGTIESFATYDAGFGAYPIVTLRGLSGERRAIHCSRAVLSGELAKLKPKVGERLGVKYMGEVAKKSGRGTYHSYSVVMPDRPKDAPLDWSLWAVDDTPDPAPAPPAPAAPATSASGNDEDIPF